MGMESGRLCGNGQTTAILPACFAPGKEKNQMNQAASQVS